MIKRFKDFVNEAKSFLEDEIFSAYNGRYLFNVSKAYELINSGDVKSRIELYPNYYLRRYSDENLSMVDSNKISKIRSEMRYEDPIGLLVKFKNPEDQESSGEWVLIDGNHRVRIAGDDGMDGKLIVVKDPEDVKKFMNFNPSIPHELFPDY
jgi:hypothetical protein